MTLAIALKKTTSNLNHFLPPHCYEVSKSSYSPRLLCCVCLSIIWASSLNAASVMPQSSHSFFCEKRFSFIKSFTLLEKMFSIASAILATLIKARITKPCGVSFACRVGADLFALHTLNLTYYTFGELLSEI